MKASTAEELLALVNAATDSDETLDLPIQHLLMQLQEQHALDQTQGPCSITGNSTVPKKSDRNHARPLSTAAVLIGSIAPKSTPLVPVPDIPIPPSTQSLTSTVMKRKSIPLSMKKEAIQWIMGPGNGIASRAEKHFNWDISASSFRKWWKNRDKIMNDSDSKKRVSGGGRKPFLEDSEEQMLVVVIQERAKKDRVTRKWIAHTAQHMFQRSDTCFKASENWVSKFIRRNGLTLKRSGIMFEPQQTNLEHQQYKALQITTTSINSGTNNAT